MVTLSPEATILFVCSAPLFDPAGISYMICGAGQTDRSSSASGQFYYAPDICSQFNTLPQLQLQLSEKRRSCFLTFFAKISWTNLVLKKKKKSSTLSPANKSQRNGDGEGKDTLPPPSHAPTPLLQYSFLDSNFIYSPLFLS